MSGIAYLGPPIDHYRGLEIALRKAGLELAFIPDSHEWGLGRAAKKTSRLRRMAALARRVYVLLWGTQDPEYLAEALRVLDEKDIRWVVAYWGTRPLSDIKALKKARPQIKFVLNLLCHPLAITPLRVKAQHFFLNVAMRSLDGLIVTSDVMRRYLLKNTANAKCLPTLLLKPTWPAEFGSAEPMPATSERPNALFMGRMDWKAGHKSDNVTERLRELMRQGIDVHFTRTPGDEIEDEHACPFDGRTLVDLVAFAAGFDVSLIEYNIDDAQVKDRFEVTVPDRVITSVFVGIPVAIPKQGFAASKEYLGAYGAVIEYASMAELAAKLKNRPFVDELRKLARTRALLYRAEADLPSLLEFLYGL